MILVLAQKLLAGVATEFLGTSCFQQLFFLYTRRSEFNDKTHLEEFISAKASDQIPEQVPLSKGPQRGDNDSEANIQCPLFIISLQKWMFGNAISQHLSTWNWNLQQMYANVTIFQPSKSPIPSSVFHLKKIKGKREEVTNTRPKFPAVYS